MMLNPEAADDVRMAPVVCLRLSEADFRTVS